MAGHLEKADELHASAGGAPTIGFGKEMRGLFNFAPTYTPLNHGSYGTCPRVVFECRQQFLRDIELRECIYKAYVFPKLLKESRALVAPLLGADTDEVVFTGNATTGINTVLRNLKYEEGDIAIHFSSIYPACLKTIEHLQELTPLRSHSIEVLYPIEDDEVTDLFEASVLELISSGKRVKLAVFDTIVSGPGVRVPWEDLVKICKRYGILSVVDAAHGIGHIDMTQTGIVSPDFLVSNCHKWLYTPRGFAVLYVPFRNQHLIATALPTSHGYEAPDVRKGIKPDTYFPNLFLEVSTIDYSPYLCLPAALKFRNEVCGGEERIREYCFRLALEGGARVAEILGTEVLANKSGSIQNCCLTNIRLPLVIYGGGLGEKGDIALDDAQAVWDWMYETAANEFDTYFQIKYYRGAFWVRFSAQIYLGMEDFEWGAKRLLELCERAKRDEWKSPEHEDGPAGAVMSWSC